jgi:Tol biopolymer transport system component
MIKPASTFCLLPFHILAVLLFVSCSKPIEISKWEERQPGIFPDYTEVTIPPNIAPLNFKVDETVREAVLILKNGSAEIIVKAKNGHFDIPSSKWTSLLEQSKGSYIDATVCRKENNEWIAFKPFKINVAIEPIDRYLAYRLIEPGYELWSEMGIYQRDLQSFTQTAIVENSMTNNNCMNCHSFCMQNPDKMVMHMRSKNAGTYIISGSVIEKLNTKTDNTISALVYPSWHPSGRYIAFSVNETKQGFHADGFKRVEVYDVKSDVVVYDAEKREIITTGKLFSESSFETFPSFSPDGHVLYFCTSDSCTMPDEFRTVKYSLCSIAFNPEKGQFGDTVDTLYNARTEGGSASFPRVSPDGKYLLFTIGDYGGFFIWHKEADLYIYNRETKEYHPLTAANSNDAESYHSWSSNSRWITFGSRRIDGLYTRPYFAYIDENGVAAKSFVMPQRNPGFYNYFMKSYNVPEMVKGKVSASAFDIASKAGRDESVDVSFRMK